MSEINSQGVDNSTKQIEDISTTCDELELQIRDLKHLIQDQNSVLEKHEHISTRVKSPVRGTQPGFTIQQFPYLKLLCRPFDYEAHDDSEARIQTLGKRRNSYDWQHDANDSTSASRKRKASANDDSPKKRRKSLIAMRGRDLQPFERRGSRNDNSNPWVMRWKSNLISKRFSPLDRFFAILGFG